MSGRALLRFTSTTKSGNPTSIDLPSVLHRQLLTEKVSFYRALDENEKAIFHREVEEFLGKVKIQGVDTVVTELDRILIASSAVIPLFAFHDWFYPNVVVVELYKDTFNADFETNGANRAILGMVGGGVMNGRMALSQKALRMGFSNETDKNNTAIHEFIHLIDKADGSVDGMPDLLLDKHMALPWLEFIREKIQEIKAGESDFNDYAATSETEFFAVACEYFFEQPQLLKRKHPKLFDMMSRIFRRSPKVSNRQISLPERNDPCYCGSGKKYKHCHGAV